MHRRLSYNNFPADLESRDFRCRTPLHLAVDMGRALAADFLISMPTPAQVRVADKDGNMAMSGMIKIMPCVVRRSRLETIFTMS